MLVLLSDRSARPVRVGPAGLRLPQNIQYTGGSILRVLHDPVPPDDWQKMSVQAMAQINGLLTGFFSSQQGFGRWKGDA